MSRARLLTILPPLLFLLFVLAAFYALQRDNPDALPSAFIGRPAPSLETLTDFQGAPPPTNADLADNGPTLINFWASWCGPCRVEHPLLMELGDGPTPLIGINYKDQPGNAAGFLADLGDPYDRKGADPGGRTGINWGIYGVPETFVIGGDGTVLLRHPGPLTREVLETRILPLLER